MKRQVETYEQKLEEEPRTAVEESFQMMLYEMDVERVKYLLVSYLRTRLQKIEKYHKYILQNNMGARLSADEAFFLNKFVTLQQTYFDSTINSHFQQPPYVLPGESMDDVSSVIIHYTQYKENEMDCPFPNRKKLVGVRVLPGNDPVEIPIDNEDTMTTIRISSDKVTIVEYEVVEPFLLNSTVFELS
ncbi:hypothetical protein WA538_000365, partial [Blastocystis sp. DL]